MELTHKTFFHETFGSLRTIFTGNMLYVSAMDLGRMLGYRDGTKAVRSYCPDLHLFGFRSESGVQRLVFLDAEQTDTLLETCHNPAADEIAHWLCNVVIPDFYGCNDEISDSDEDSDLTDDLTSVAEDILMTAKGLSDIVGRLLKMIESNG